MGTDSELDAFLARALSKQKPQQAPSHSALLILAAARATAARIRFDETDGAACAAFGRVLTRSWSRGAACVRRRAQSAECRAGADPERGAPFPHKRSRVAFVMAMLHDLLF
jgi:hypothetical protein